MLASAMKHPRRIHTSRRKVRDLAIEARTQGLTETSFSGDCTRPVEMHLFGAPDPVLHGLGLEPDRKVSQMITVRCRKCEQCLAHRRRLWTARGIHECRVSSRTWFGTLTLHPDRALQSLCAARLRMEQRQSEPSDENLFKERVRFISPEITKFLKRVRKTARFRYLLVTEAHQSGVPHWHLLVHEQGNEISKRELERCWKYGFSHWRLVDVFDPKAAGYACKYLSKTLSTRVRGSDNYGSNMGPLAERIEGASEVLTEEAQCLGTRCLSPGSPEKGHLTDNSVRESETTE